MLPGPVSSPENETQQQPHLCLNSADHFWLSTGINRSSFFTLGQGDFKELATHPPATHGDFYC